MGVPLLVVGLGGGSWAVLKPAVARGDMPHLAALLRTGSHGDLHGFLPTYLNPNWAAFWSGTHPGRHSIFGAMAMGKDTLHSASTADLPFPSWLELVSGAGIEVVSVYVPFTMPPPVVAGSVVGSGRSPRVHPVGMANDLEERFAEMPVDLTATHFPSDGFRSGRDIDTFVDRHIQSMVHTGELAVHLVQLGDPGVVIVDFHSIDRLLHALWPNEDEPLSQDMEAGLERGLRALDHELGALISHCQPAAVLALSDHGMTRCTGLLRLAPALHAAGILERRPLRRPLLKRLARVSPARFARRRQDRPLRPAPGSRREQRWRLAADPHATVFLSDKSVYLRSSRETAANLAKALTSLRDPVTGVHPIKRVWDARDLYESFARDDWRVLVLEQSDGYTLRTGNLSEAPFESMRAGRDYLAGTHTTTGFWVMSGRGVTPGREAPAGVTDFAPAILNLLEVAVPHWMEGDPAVLIG